MIHLLFTAKVKQAWKFFSEQWFCKKKPIWNSKTYLELGRKSEPEQSEFKIPTFLNKNNGFWAVVVISQNFLKNENYSLQHKIQKTVIFTNIQGFKNKLAFHLRQVPGLKSWYWQLFSEKTKILMYRFHPRYICTCTFHSLLRQLYHSYRVPQLKLYNYRSLFIHPIDHFLMFRKHFQILQTWKFYDISSFFDLIIHK